MFNRIFKPKWQHADVEVREAELAQLAYPADKEIITTMARSDSDSRIRLMALAKIDSQEELQAILSQTSQAVDWIAVASQLSAKAPNTDSALVIAFSRQRQNWRESDLITAIGQVGESELIKSFIVSVEDEQLLHKVLLATKSLTLRLQIIEQISQYETLNQLLKQLTHKQLLQAVRAKLKIHKQQQDTQSANRALAEKLIVSLAKLSRQEWDSQFDAQLKLAQQKWGQIDAESRQPFEDEYSRELEKCQQIVFQQERQVESLSRIRQLLAKQQTLIEQLENITRELTEESQSSHHPLEDALRLIDKNWQQVNQEISKESIPAHEAKSWSLAKAQFQELKHQLQGFFAVWDAYEQFIPELHSQAETRPEAELESLNNWVSAWDKLRRQLDWPSSLAKPQQVKQWEVVAASHRQKLAELKSAQKKKAEYLKQKLGVLAQHIRQKNLIAANKLFNYLEHEKDKLNGRYRQQFEQKLTKRLPDLEELRDWHAFATTPKKNQLCEAMEALAKNPQAPLKRAEAVRKLQQDWQALNASDSNADQALWDRFQAAAETAFQPCLAYYAEQDTKKADNLANRLALCEQLEEAVANTDWQTVDWKNLDKWQQQIKQSWKQFAPVPQSEHKAAQARFNQANTVISDRLKAEKQTNLDARELLIAKALKLDAMDDLDNAIDSAKRLQDEWKGLGITFYQADRSAWKKFRQAINAVFEKRDIAKQEFVDELKNNEAQLKRITQKINDLSQLKDDSLKASQGEFEQLADSWDNAKTLPRASAKQTLAAFNEACEKYKKRYAGIETRTFERALAQVRSLLEQCQQVEESLVAGQQPDLTLLAEQINRLVEIPEAANALQKRLEAIKGYTPNQDYTLAKTDAENLALQAEIVAGIESPAEFKTKRMEMQLQQLQQSFSTSDNSQNIKAQLLDFYYRWLAIALFSQQASAQLKARFERVLEIISR